MLLENFYKIIHIKEREDGKQAIEIELNPGHVLYQGHFPGQPVVPGVCTLQIIKESAEQIANQPLQYVQIASLILTCHQYRFQLDKFFSITNAFCLQLEKMLFRFF